MHQKPGSRLWELRAGFGQIHAIQDKHNSDPQRKVPALYHKHGACSKDRVGFRSKPHSPSILRPFISAASLSFFRSSCLGCRPPFSKADMQHSQTVVQTCILFMEEPNQFSVGQTAQSLTFSIMEKPHTGLDDCLRMLLPCFRKRMSVSNTHSGDPKQTQRRSHE